jgi:hypothetical protein
MIWCFPEFDYQRALRGYLLSQPTVFFRRRVIETYQLDPTLRLAPDTVLWLMVGRDFKFAHLGRIQAADRDHSGRLTNTEGTQLRKVHEEAMAAYGAAVKTSRMMKTYDLLVKLVMRIKGLSCAARLAVCSDLAEQIAFPMWVDSWGRVIRRQLTMRIGARADLGLRRAVNVKVQDAGE